MKWIFVLGRNPELSLIELETYLNTHKVKYKILEQFKNILVIELEKELNIDNLGGIIKMAKVIAESNKIEDIEYSLDQVSIDYGTSNKINYYVTAYASDLEDFVKSYLKSLFKKEGLKAYYKKSDSPSDLIKKKGVEFICFKDHIAITVDVSNTIKLKERDVGRPAPDFVNAVSLRLAKIMINMAGVKKSTVLLDPFCGCGSILQEGLLLGVNVIGSDSNNDMVKKSKKNLDWLRKRYKFTGEYKVLLSDCRELTRHLSRNSVDVVVTEPYMGPFIRQLPTVRESHKIMSGLEKIYTGLFAQLKVILKKSGKIVIIMPTIKTNEKKMVGLNMSRMLKLTGLEVVSRTLYQNPENRLIRHIYVISKV